MLRNYIKIAFRSLLRQKIHSAINILGLSVGIACCILIVFFICDELTFDRFHTNAGRIYRAYVVENWGENQEFTDVNTPFPLGPALKDNLQEVEAMSRINFVGMQVKVQDRKSMEQVMIVGQDFLEMFDFPMVTGDKKNLLNEISDIVLTETAAKKYFGETDAIGKGIQLMLGERYEDFTVKAVAKDPPVNSSIRFTMFISELNNSKLFSERMLTSAWFNIMPETYVMLKPDALPNDVSAKFPSIFKPLLGDDYELSKFSVFLQPLTSIHLDNSLPAAYAPVSDPKYSYILGAIALLILVVACINFVTLSLGRSLKRAKEVGIRKVAGAQRYELISQFVGEAVLVTIVSMVAGLLLSFLLLPLFNDLSGKQLSFSVDTFMVSVLAMLVCVIGLMAGSYPAFVLSSFRPVAVLKGVLKTGGTNQTFRKVLVGMQLVLSVFLISCTLLMRNQLEFLQSKNLGFDREQLVSVQLNVKDGSGMRDRVQKGFLIAEAFKNELARASAVQAACVSSHDFGRGEWANFGYTDEQNVYQTFYYNTVDISYLEVMKIQLVQGRNFSATNPSDLKRSIIINESLAQSYGWNDAIGKRLPGKKFGDHEVIGVVKDFNYGSLYTKVQPLVLALDGEAIMNGVENVNFGNSPIPKVLVRLRTGETYAGIDQIKAAWNKLTDGDEFNFSFVDESIAAQYRTDRNLGRMVKIATLLAIVIGSLGLYGLASLTIQNRTKEIGIRKVLGATDGSVLALLSKDYIFLVLISSVVASPLAWYAMSQWLSSFEYRVEMGPGVFVLGAVAAMIIAILTISAEAVRASRRAPSSALKHE